MPIWKQLKTPTLSIAKEKILLVKAKKGNKRAVKQLLLAYSRLIVQAASHRRSSKRHMIDLLETANLTFLETIKTYPVGKRSRFWPYAARRINQSLSKVGKDE